MKLFLFVKTSTIACGCSGRGARLALMTGAILHCRLRSQATGIFAQAAHYAEYEVYLSKKYGAASFYEWWRWRQYGRSWRFLLGRVPQLLRTPEGKTMLAWRLGRQIGLPEGQSALRRFSCHG